MEEPKEQPANSASGNTSKSKLRYPLRSTLKSKDKNPPATESSASSSSKRGPSLHAVSQSTTALEFSAKDDKSTKPTRRFSIPAKASGSSASKSLSSLTPVSESRVKQSDNARWMTEKNVARALRLANRKKVEDLSSATYWLSQIELSESVAKHLISLGFFKLAHEAGCEPLEQMREELKSYACRNYLEELEDAMKELCQLYNISEDPKQLQISETCSVMPEETTVSLNKDAQSASSTPENSNMIPQIPKQDDASRSSIVPRTVKERSAKNTPQGKTRRSSKDIKVNTENGSEVEESEEEETRSSDDGVANVTARSSHGKRKVRKEAACKNNPSVRTRKLAITSSANSLTLPETRGDKSQKKSERTVNPRSKRNQEEKNETKKSSTKKSVDEEEGQTTPPEQTDPLEDDKENTVSTSPE